MLIKGLQPLKMLKQSMHGKLNASEHRHRVRRLPFPLHSHSESCFQYSGGGPGGLALSVVLGKYCDDVHIDLYEDTPNFIEVGAGISVWKRTWSILQTLGLDKSLGDLVVDPPVDELSKCYHFVKRLRVLTKRSDRTGFCVSEE